MINRWRAIAVAACALGKTGRNALMSWNWRRLAIPGCLTVFAVAGVAQMPPPVTLEIDIENYVQYWDDGGEPSKFASDAKDRTTTRIFAAFLSTLHLADIVAVNGRPAKGLYINRSQLLRFSPTSSPGLSIADIARSGGPGLQSFEILQPDGTPVGTIMAQWLVGGSVPPGSPAAIASGNGAIIGGGCLRMLLSLTPMSRPEIQVTATGPAVVHSSDFSVVTAAKPARFSRCLPIGLGPVRGNVDPGKPFPTSPPALVNSPVEVFVNGVPAEVLAAVG